jgi:hypothetical protein
VNKNYSLRLLFVALKTSLIITGCNPQSNPESDPTWGMFKDSNHLRLVTLLNLPPQSKVCVSGYNAEKAVWAINQWSTAAGRQNHLKAASCYNEAGARSIRIVGPESGSCDPNVAGKTDTVSEVKICQNFQENILDHVFLHEIGHMWGLCDQYDGGRNCQGGTTNPNTVMGAASGLQSLTPDDIEGIRAVTQSDSIPANQAWKSIQASTLSSPPESTQGQQQTTSPPQSQPSQGPTTFNPTQLGSTPNQTGQPNPPGQPSSNDPNKKICIQMGTLILCER